MNKLPLKRVRKYLVRFGYLTKAAAQDSSPEPTLQALERFQTFHGIAKNDDAERTKSTLETMGLRRCGVVDAEGGEPKEGCSWPVGHDTLVYDFGRLTDDLPEEEVLDALEQAVIIWNDVLLRQEIPLKLVRKQEGQEVVHVQFAWVEHDQDIPFSEIPVAHADFPPACGVLSQTLPRPVHFEEDQDWNQLDITAVAVHELGHVLGLTHSNDSGSVMFSSVDIGQEPTEDDERELKRLYRRHIKDAAKLRAATTLVPIVEPPAEGSAHP